MTQFIITALITAVLIHVVIKSIYIIPTGRGYYIELLGTAYRGVGNFPGYKINRENNSHPYWELMKDDNIGKPGIFDNIYFFLYPFFKKKVRDIVYQKEIGVEEKQLGDQVLWTSEDGTKLVILRKSTSDHVRLRQPMPRVNSDVFTGDGLVDGKVVGQMAKIITKSNNIVRLNNIFKAFYSTDDTMLAIGSAIDSRHRSFMATHPVQDIKKIEDEKGSKSSDGKPGYFEYMEDVNLASDLPDDGIAEKFGYTLEHPYFEAMRPGDDAAKTLFDLMNKDAQAHLTGQAKITEKTAEGKAYKAEKDQLADADHNYGVQVGKIMVDADGKVTGLRPDANVAAMAQAFSDLGKTTGTVMIGANAVPTIPVGNN